jgi:hypothetical protein
MTPDQKAGQYRLPFIPPFEEIVWPVGLGDLVCANLYEYMTRNGFVDAQQALHAMRAEDDMGGAYSDITGQSTG